MKGDRSESFSLEKQRQKVRDYLTLGMVVGVVVDPRIQTLEVYGHLSLISAVKIL